MTSKDLANELRSGELLCNIIQKLIPESIDLNKINKNADQSRILSCYNINMFLDACRFHLPELDAKSYFEAELLYDHVELRPSVMRFFEQFSKCKLFSNNNISNVNNKSDSLNLSNEISKRESVQDDADVYINVHTNENTNNNMFMYAPPQFFNRNSELKFCSDVRERTAAYDRQTQFKVRNDEYVVKEILTTEEDYCRTLKNLIEIYLEPLNKVLSYENSKKISVNFQLILNVHKTLLYKITEIIEIPRGNYLCYFLLQSSLYLVI